MNVLSLFDGISCGRLALERAGIKVDKYYASEIDKHAIRITQHNYPDTIQLGDVTKIDFNQFIGKIDLLIGGSPCFTENTLVLTSEGLLPIKDIKEGDYVLTHNNNWKRILKVGGKITETLDLSIFGFPTTTTTKNHPYLVRKVTNVWNNAARKYDKVIGDKQWVAAEKLVKNDYLVVPIIQEEENPYNLTDDECFIIGRYIADGHTRKDLRKERGRKGRYYAIILSIGNKKYFQTPVKHKIMKHTQNTERMVFCNKRLTEIVEKECGCGAINKHISSTLLKLPKDKLKKIIAGYVSGDGTVRGNRTRVQTISPKLVVSLQMALAKVYGIVGGLHTIKNKPTRVIEGRTVNQQPFAYLVEWRSAETVRRRSINCGDHVLVPFKSMTINKADMVYNLEVEDDNSYTANGVCVHNCTGFSPAGKGLNFEDPQSKLFFKYLEALQTIKPKYFLLENVKMKKEWEDIITNYMGVQPIAINSELVSAQNRRRLYWTNIPDITMPEDRGIMLKDIVHEHVDNYTVEQLQPYIIDPEKSLTLLEKETEKGKIGYYGIDSQGTRVYTIHGKSVTLVGNAGGMGGKTGLYLFGCITPDRVNKRQNGQRFSTGEKFYTLTAQDQHGILIDGYIRKLTPTECERLQTVPDDYTELGEDVCCLNTYNIIKEREIACKSVKSMIATTPLQTEKQDYVINIICALSDTEQPNLRETQLSEMKNVLLTDVIDGNKQEADYVLNTIKDLRKQAAQMLNKKNRKNVNIVIDWQLQEDCVTSIIKIGLDTETHNIQISLDKETMHMGIERLKANIKYNIEKSLRKCSDEICCLKKLYTILILINLIIIKKIYMFAVKANTQVYTSSSIKLQGNLLSVALSNSKMVSILPISSQQRYKCLGNGWTVDVISHIFSFMPDITQEDLF